MSEQRWRIRLSRLAELDFLQILDTTTEKFGPRQADIYEGHLLAALMALESGPDIIGSVARFEIRPGLRTFHLARLGVPSRHLVCYRAVDGRIIEVLRILHDAVDLPRHIPPQADAPDSDDV